MTGMDVRERDFSVPPGQVREEWLKKQAAERSLARDAEGASTGKIVGIDFDYEKVFRTPNTLVGHRLLWWAEQRNHQDDLAGSPLQGLFHRFSAIASPMAPSPIK